MLQSKIIKQEARKILGSIKGVQGFGVVENKLRVYISEDAARTEIPQTFQGLPVDIVWVGKVEFQGQ